MFVDQVARMSLFGSLSSVAGVLAAMLHAACLKQNDPHEQADVAHHLAARIACDSEGEVYGGSFNIYHHHHVFHYCFLLCIHSCLLTMLTMHSETTSTPAGLSPPCAVDDPHVSTRLLMSLCLLTLVA